MLDTSVRNEDLDSLLDDPAGPQWKERGIAKGLERRLSDVREEYVNVLDELIETIATLWQKMGANKPAFQMIIDQRLVSRTQFTDTLYSKGTRAIASNYPS